jgi:hypothetical protein
MSVLVACNGVPELPQKQRLTATTRTTVYTNGASSTQTNKNAAITSIAIANEGNAAKKISIEYSIDAGSNYFLLWRGSIAADSALAADIPGLPLILNPGGILAATAETANFLTVTTSSVMLG